MALKSNVGIHLGLENMHPGFDGGLHCLVFTGLCPLLVGQEPGRSAAPVP